MLSTCYIGRYCSLGNEIKIIVGNHPTNYVSTHPFCYSSAFEKEGLLFSNIIKFDYVSIVEKGKDIEIGNDVWIGDNVIILGGVKIGNGAVIGAGALVTKDVIPYSIVVGVPARVIKMRFEKKHIEMLEE
ncbi:MAG: CatB-related O-acetyltransferase, partial [Cetobacterium sp.]